MEIKRRDLLGMGAALGMGIAANGVLGQEGAGPSGAQRRRPPAGRGGMFGRGSEPPVNTHTQPSSVDLNYKPRRVNKCIELWEDGQPIYYGGSGLGTGVDSYAQGIRMAQTYMDAINVEMEHGVLDLVGLREFMRGLVDGGPTPSGHRTPTVFGTCPMIGLDPTYARANTWVYEQFLDAGVHGMSICHARNPDAVATLMQMGMRFPFSRAGIPKPAYPGLRGSSASYAAEIWGVDINKYCHIADLWPLNKQGEIICGLKIEDTYADEDAAQTMALPGVAWTEWGPGDHAYSLYGLSIMPESGPSPADVEFRPQMLKVRQAVLDNCKKSHVMFLNQGNTDPNSLFYVVQQIKEGTMMFSSNEAAAIVGREYSKRKMPV